jgi:hypothetical protein
VAPSSSNALKAFQEGGEKKQRRRRVGKPGKLKKKIYFKRKRR